MGGGIEHKMYTGVWAWLSVREANSKQISYMTLIGVYSDHASCNYHIYIYNYIYDMFTSATLHHCMYVGGDYDLRPNPLDPLPHMAVNPLT